MAILEAPFFGLPITTAAALGTLAAAPAAGIIVALLLATGR